MFWRFGFASTSTLDTLLEKPNVTVEELLDEDDLLQECKAQNGKLIDFLSQKRTIKRLFEHVVGLAEVSGSGGKEWEEKVRFKYPYVASEVLSSEIFAIVETVLANPEDLLDPFWNAILNSRPEHVQPPLPHHSHPLLAGSPSASPIPPGKSLPGEGNADRNSRGGGHDDSSSSSSSSDSNHEGSATTIRAIDNGPGKSVLAGYWAKVNGVFLDKKPREMLAYIRDLPRIVERFVAHLETPAAVDLLYRIISCEQSLPAAGVIEWLSNHDLIPQMVELLAPTYSVDLHNTVSELLKAIIALSAPSPGGMAPGQEAFGFGNSASFGGQDSSMGVQNKLVRELASEPMVRKMVAFMLDSAHGSELTRRLSTAAADQTSRDIDPGDDVLSFGTKNRRTLLGGSSLSSCTENSAIVDDEDADDADPQPLNPSLTPAFDVQGSYHRDSTATIRPTNFFPPVCAPQTPVTRETSISSLITGIGIFIELIRKNNSDYFEQHLFHALRSHLLQRQQEIAARKLQAQSEAGTSNTSLSEAESSGSRDKDEKDEEDEEMEGMEEAMLEMTDKLGIVHLGPMLTALCERLPEFQALIERPRSDDSHILTTLGKVKALSFERYRIAELYAELLHCSNMALLNRPAGEGPVYSSNGVLQGGIQGLQILARTLQGADADDSSDHPVPTVDAADSTLSSSSSMNGIASATSEDGKVPSAGPQGRHTRQTHGPESSEEGDSSSKFSGDQNDPFADVSPSGDKETEDEPMSSPGQDAEIAEEDAKSIRSALSSMSLAELTTPQHSEPASPLSDIEQNVVGDLLKKKFLDGDVIPTILSLFFDYPWNNFFHNVVYDILQQCFNGRMDAGLNRRLTIAVFENGRLPEKILEGQQRNDESMQGPRRIRLGFMGHLNLIAEETVKLLERYPQEIGDAVASTIPQPAWDNFVNESLKENREKESAPLAGGKPMTTQFGFGVNNQAGGGMEEDGVRVGSLGGETGDNGSFANYLSAQMGGTSSDDDDSDEESSWLNQDPRSSGFADAFQPGVASGSSVTATTNVHEDQDDDDEWGPFSASDGTVISSSRIEFKSSASQPLTAADWAATSFGRSGSPEDVISMNDSTFGGEDEAEEEESSPSEDQFPFVDLSDATSYRIAQATAASLQRRRSSGGGSASGSMFPSSRRRRASSSAGSGSTDPSAAQAIDEDQPLGPGVSPKDTEVRDGMLIRKLSDGRTVSVPLDDVALAQLAEEQRTEAHEFALDDED